MSIKDEARKWFKEEITEHPGFVLTEPPATYYRKGSVDQFRQALAEAQQATVMVDTNAMGHIDFDGRIEGTDWRLSRTAFSDLCRIMQVPSGFMTRLGKANPDLSMEVLDDALTRFWHEGYKFVLDSRNGRIDGVVGTETYSPISHEQVVDYALEANPDLRFTNGWLSGPVMRATFISDLNVLEPKKGDIVHTGLDLTNSTHGDLSVWLRDYLERLECLNGLVSTHDQGRSRIEHIGDVAFKVQKAAVDAASRAESVGPVMAAAVTLMMDLARVQSIRGHIEKEGGRGMFKSVANKAMTEALNENRVEEETTLWNWVNGITAYAKESGSVKRRAELEGFGYDTLVTFGKAHVN